MSTWNSNCRTWFFNFMKTVPQRPMQSGFFLNIQGTKWSAWIRIETYLGSFIVASIRDKIIFEYLGYLLYLFATIPLRERRRRAEWKKSHHTQSPLPNPCIYLVVCRHSALRPRFALGSIRSSLHRQDEW